MRYNEGRRCVKCCIDELIAKILTLTDEEVAEVIEMIRQVQEDPSEEST